MVGINGAIIASGRRFNKLLMLSKCKITVNAGFSAPDPDTLAVEPDITVLYGPGVDEPGDGRCKIRIAAASAGIMEREPLGQSFAVQEMILSLPLVAETGAIPTNADIEILTNSDDPALEGVHFRLKKDAQIQTTATQRRYIVEAVG